jgi:hypothetical protein
MCLLKALICGEFPSNRIDYKSVDEKENDPPLGRQSEESDFIRCVLTRMLRRLFFRTNEIAETVSMLYYALDIQGGEEREEKLQLSSKKAKEKKLG